MNSIAVPLFYCSILLLGMSMYLFLSEKYKAALLFLVFGALVLSVFSALLDPFLNLWDERFHALVAKNMVHHPLMPTLYDDPVVQMPYDRWDRYHIWLHKQPLFLWQISLFFKIFGAGDFVLRIPNIIQNTLMVVLIYRIGKITINERVGIISGFLFVTSHYVLELVAGRQALDHNDVAFLFYITCSIWSFLEYLKSGNRYWILVTGLFSGCAVLCKWLAGLLVYFIWVIYLLLARPATRRHYVDLLISIVVAALVVLPWQFLIIRWYPAEALFAYQYNALHFNHIIEGHGGDKWYYFSSLSTLYGNLVPWLIVPGIYFIKKEMKDKKLLLALFVVMPVFIYAFFTLAKTKMLSYPFIVSPVFYIAAGSLLNTSILKFSRINVPAFFLKTITFLFLATIAWYDMDFELLRRDHAISSNGDSYSRIMVENKKIFSALRLQLPANSIIFNVKGRHYIECMFYSGFPAYNFIPSEEQYGAVKNANRRIAIFADNIGTLPLYLARDPSVIILHPLIRGFE
ncbi:MAG: glycosyltransferase family 39 protein [Bacteroidetes bacterium]|nr:glycosyltransferase family 39 protein [Bacteroidota bacterium]